MDGKQILWVLLGAGGAFLLVWFFRKLKAAQDEIKAIIEQRFAGQVIHKQDPFALHVARQSAGYSQKRGNGQLILTDEELFFAMPCPMTVISIPLSSLLEVGRTMRMGGKCIMRPMLKVGFRTAEGLEDAIAFHVKGLDAWEAVLKEKMQSS